MIIARIHGYIPEGKGLVVQFSEPDETFKQQITPLVVVSSEAELYRRLFVKNKVYICDTLDKWLNQRLHARKSQISRILHLQDIVAKIRYYPYEKVCWAIAQNKNQFDIIINENSTYYKHYLSVIKPIIEECDNVYTGKAKVHYC